MLVGLALVLFQSPPAKWVVQGVTPERTPSGLLASLSFSYQQGDLDGNGADDILRTVNDWYIGGQWVGLRGGARGWWYLFIPWLSTRSDYWRDLTTMRSPIGLLLVGAGFSQGYVLMSFDPRSGGSPLASASRYAPPFLMRMEDLDGDGWDDLYYQDSNGGTLAWTGVFSGRDLSILWEVTHQGAYSPLSTFRDAAGPLPDLDGDGVSEVLSAWLFRDFNPPTPDQEWGHHIMVFSGASGALLWETQGYGSGGTGSPAIGPDVTGDGFPDVYLAVTSFVALFSGSDGMEVWDFDPAVAFGQAPPPGYSFRATLAPAMVTTTPLGRRDLVVPAFDTAIGGTSLYTIGHFDPVSGAFLGRAALPVDLQPWYPDLFASPNYGLTHPLGDVDRDGLEEVGFSVPVPSVDPGLVPIFTLSMETLSVPPQLQVGTGNGFDAEISIPSGANRPCYLLLSRSFDRNGGLLVDGWKTHLGPDPWLDRSSTTRSLQVQLDAQGRGAIHVPIPPDPNLVGATVYTKAVVLESAAPGAEVWTVSTPGVTELVL